MPKKKFIDARNVFTGGVVEDLGLTPLKLPSDTELAIDYRTGITSYNNVLAVEPDDIDTVVGYDSGVFKNYNGLAQGQITENGLWAGIPTKNLNDPYSEVINNEKWGLNFTRSGYVLTTEWIAESGSYVEFEFTLADSTTGFQHFIGGILDGSQSPYIRIQSTNLKMFTNGFSTTVEVDGVPTLIGSNGMSFLRGKSYHIKANRTTSLPIQLIGARGNGGVEQLQGSMSNVRFVDVDNPNNSRYYEGIIVDNTQPSDLSLNDELYDPDTAPFYTPGYINGNSILMNAPINVEIGDTIEFKASLDEIQSTYTHWFGSSPRGFNLYVNTSNNNAVSFGAGMTVEIDGNVYNSSFFSMTMGTFHSFKVTFTNAGIIQFLGSENTNNGSWSGRMYEIIYTSISDPNKNRYYPSLEYRPDEDATGIVLKNEVLQQQIIRNNDFTDGLNWWNSANGAVLSVTDDILSIENPTGVGDMYAFTSSLLATTESRQLDYYIKGDYTDYTSSSGRYIEFRIANPDPDITTRTVNVSLPTINEPFEQSGTVDIYQNNGDYLQQVRLRSRAGIFKVDEIQVRENVDGVFNNFPTDSWIKSGIDNLTVGNVIDFPVGNEWVNNISDESVVYLGNGRYEITNPGGGEEVAWFNFNINEALEDYSVSWDIINGEEYFDGIIFSSNTYDQEYIETDYSGSATYETKSPITNPKSEGVRFNSTSVAGDKITIDIFVEKNEISTPYVENERERYNMEYESDLNVREDSATYIEKFEGKLLNTLDTAQNELGCMLFTHKYYVNQTFLMMIRFTNLQLQAVNDLITDGINTIIYTCENNIHQFYVNGTLVPGNVQISSASDSRSIPNRLYFNRFGRGGLNNDRNHFPNNRQLQKMIVRRKIVSAEIAMYSKPQLVQIPIHGEQYQIPRGKKSEDYLNYYNISDTVVDIPAIPDRLYRMEDANGDKYIATTTDGVLDGDGLEENGMYYRLTADLALPVKLEII